MEEKKMQRALIHYNKPENRSTVIAALKKADREDLIPVLLPYNRGAAARSPQTQKQTQKTKSAARTSSPRKNNRRR